MRRNVGWPVVAALPVAMACASTGVQTGDGPGAAGGTPLTRLGEAVQVTNNPMRSRVCEFVTDLPLRSTSPDDADAIRALRNQAGTVGSNMLLLVMASETTIGRAEAYLCVE